MVLTFFLVVAIQQLRARQHLTDPAGLRIGASRFALAETCHARER